MVRYCFYDKCFLGVMLFHSETDIEMQWEKDEKLTQVARMFKKLNRFDTSKQILDFFEERTIPDERPDKTLWYSMLGVGSDFEATMRTYCSSQQDLFWFSEHKNLTDYDKTWCVVWDRILRR